MYALLPTNLFIVVSSVPGHLCPFLRWRFDTPGVFFCFFVASSDERDPSPIGSGLGVLGLVRCVFLRRCF